MIYKIRELPKTNPFSHAIYPSRPHKGLLLTFYTNSETSL